MKTRCSTSLKLFKESNDVTRRRILAIPFFVTPFGSLLNSKASELNIDLPPDAIRSYLQYRLPLQISADYYMFDLKEFVTDFDSWGEINSMFSSNNARAGVSVSRIERDFINPMRILTLSMPPDIEDELRDAAFSFEKSMSQLYKSTKGIRRDLPVDLSPSLITDVKKSWENGRLSFNTFLDTINKATGLNELKLVAVTKSEYPRSERKYLELKKTMKLCQNRGGQTLSNTWGKLMVSGYMQDSCGIPDLEGYLYQ